MRRYSTDLRERVIDFIALGNSTRAASKVYQISEKTARRWRDYYRATGLKEGQPKGGDRRSLITGERASWLIATVEAKPDATLEDYRAMLFETFTLSIATSSVWEFLNKHNLTFKKNTSRKRTASP